MSTLRVNTIKSLNESAGNPLTIDDSLVSSGSSVGNDGTNAQSIAFGQANTTNGVAAVSLAGRFNSASSYAATLAGDSCEASGFYSVAMGKTTEALKTGTFTHGLSTVASASYAHAEGRSTFVDGDYAHAEGYQTTASGDYSHAEGYKTRTTQDYQTVVGQYNTSRDIEGAFIVGGGLSEGTRKNTAMFTTSSIVFDPSVIPTSSLGLEVGSIYRTGSDFDEIKIKL